MLSHTVPRRLLDNFAFDDKKTKSRRLWRYEKGKPPYNRIPPSRATAWNGHFADPNDPERERRIEDRLQHDFEDPVNVFLDELQDPAFVATPAQQVALGHYLRMLFHRSTARKSATEHEKKEMMHALRTVRDNPNCVAEIIRRWTVDLLYQGIDGVVTRQMVRDAINERIRDVQSPGWSQGSYLNTMEHMMEFPDNLLTLAKYRVIATTSHHPFVIGDAPVVTWVRIPDKGLSLAEGFGRPDVEAHRRIAATEDRPSTPEFRSPRDHSGWCGRFIFPVPGLVFEKSVAAPGLSRRSRVSLSPVSKATTDRLSTLYSGTPCPQRSTGTGTSTLPTTRTPACGW
jgi:Protein of unknown function (DUF4238)